MKTNIISVVGIMGLVALVAGLASVFEIRLASAQEEATSSAPISSDATGTPPVSDTSTTTPVESNALSTEASEPPSTASDATTTSQADGTEVEQNDIAASVTPIGPPPPGGLHLVHIIGMKYTDYFTDGSTTIAVPGDPAIDSHFDIPDAPIPTHEGMTWVQTTGGWLYDTPGGDLEVGDYALQPSGTYIQNAPPFVSSTSTPAELTTPTSDSPPQDASTTAPAPSDNSAITTSADSTTSPTL